MNIGGGSGVAGRTTVGGSEGGPACSVPDGRRFANTHSAGHAARLKPLAKEKNWAKINLNVPILFGSIIAVRGTDARERREVTDQGLFYGWVSVYR
jgi:hypothetical protein